MHTQQKDPDHCISAPMENQEAALLKQIPAPKPSRRKALYRVEGYENGDKFGEAGYRPENVRMIRAASPEVAERNAGLIWESQGKRPQLIIALPT